jgi:hypothetical protein
MADLIGSVQVTPTQPAPGQSVLVQVLDPSGTPYPADSSVTIALDGIPVPSRYYQFPTAGTRTIAVYAAGNGTTETATATVDVTGAPLAYHRTLSADGGPPGPGQIPFIVLAQDLSAPYQAAFSLATPPATAAAAARALAGADKADAGQPPPAAAVAQPPPAGFLALQSLFSAGPAVSGQHIIVPKPVTLPTPSTSYVWTFGDGQVATTDTPSVVHDYFGAITPGRVPFAFDVQCRIVHDDITVTRTLVLYSAYGMCQYNGVTVPNVAGDVFATLNSDRTAFSASLLVYNIEATAITIDQMAIVPVWDDATASFPAFAFKQMAQPVIIASHSSSLLAIQTLRSDLSDAASGATVSGFIVAFQGTLAAAAAPGPEPLAEPAVPALPTVDGALRNQLGTGGIVRPSGVASIVRFSRHVRLPLQDQQLPPPPKIPIRPVPVLLGNLGKATLPVVRSGSLAVDPATSVVSVALTTPTPTAAQAAQVRGSVLSALNAPNTAGGAQ